MAHQSSYDAPLGYLPPGFQVELSMSGVYSRVCVPGTTTHARHTPYRQRKSVFSEHIPRPCTPPLSIDVTATADMRIVNNLALAKAAKDASAPGFRATTWAHLKKLGKLASYSSKKQKKKKNTSGAQEEGGLSADFQATLAASGPYRRIQQYDDDEDDVGLDTSDERIRAHVLRNYPKPILTARRGQKIRKQTAQREWMRDKDGVWHSAGSSPSKMAWKRMCKAVGKLPFSKCVSMIGMRGGGGGREEEEKEEKEEWPVVARARTTVYNAGRRNSALLPGGEQFSESSPRPWAEAAYRVPVQPQCKSPPPDRGVAVIDGVADPIINTSLPSGTTLGPDRDDLAATPTTASSATPATSELPKSNVLTAATSPEPTPSMSSPEISRIESPPAFEPIFVCPEMLSEVQMLLGTIEGTSLPAPRRVAQQLDHITATGTSSTLVTSTPTLPLTIQNHNSDTALTAAGGQRGGGMEQGGGEEESGGFMGSMGMGMGVGGSTRRRWWSSWSRIAVFVKRVRESAFGHRKVVVVGVGVGGRPRV